MWRTALIAVFVVVFGNSSAEIVYRWDKNRILPQLGVDKWRATSFAFTKNKVFLTLVDIEKESLGNGVVGTFNYSSTSSDLSIFPFQNFYKINDSERGKITTPIAVRTDDCERLWLLDSAIQNIAGTQIKRNPAIYVFNTKNSQLIRSFKIPSTQWTTASFFVNFVIETDSVDHDCEESYGYFADFNRFHLLTYDFLRNKSELKSHPFFSPDPLLHIPEEFLFNTGHQDLNGVYGLAVTSDHGTNSLYFHPLASTYEFRISTQVLKSETSLNYHDVEVYENKGEDTAAGVSVYDPETDMIFFAELKSKKIGAFKPKEATSSSHPKNFTYYKYDLKLKSGSIVDLAVRNSALWALVDDIAQVTIHKISVADLIDSYRYPHHYRHPKLKNTNSASHKVLESSIFCFTIIIVFQFFVIFNQLLARIKILFIG